MAEPVKCACALVARVGRCMFGCTGTASTRDEHRATTRLCDRCYDMGCEATK